MNDYSDEADDLLLEGKPSVLRTLLWIAQGKASVRLVELLIQLGANIVREIT